MAETKARFLADTQKADTTAEAFTWPTGRATQDNYVLAMTDTSSGTTGWQVTATAPTVTGVSGELNTYENSTEDGGTLTLTGTDFGTDASAIDSIKIMKSDGTNEISASSFGTPTDTGIPNIVFNGSETNYNTFPADTTWYIQVQKSGLSSNRFSSGKSFTKDPTISAITQSVASADYNSGFTGTSGHFGSYGGPIEGGGEDSNTKLLLNFDQNYSIDFEDSSNLSGGDGQKVTSHGNALIKRSPFGDGKTAMFFDGSDDKLEVDSSSDFNMGTSPFTIEWWMNWQDTTNDMIVFSQHSDSNNRWYIQVKSGWDIKVFARSSGTTYCEQHFDINFYSNEWNHFALVRDTSSLKLYYNGVEQSSSGTALGTNQFGQTSADQLQIGTYDGESDNFANCYLDEIRIVKGTAVYSGPFTVPTSRLTKNWSGLGTNITDYASGNNVKLLIHSNLGSYGVHHGIESQRSYTITTNATSYSGSVGQAIDGVNTNTYGLTDAQNVATNNLYFTIDLGEYAVGAARTEVFNKFYWTQSSYGASDDKTHGNWKIQYWNGSSWNDATGGSITDLGDTADAHDFTNTTAYQKYQITGVSGTTDSSPYIHEIGFANATFTDSSNSNHNITATGVYHSQGHGGIAPAMTFPVWFILMGMVIT